MANKRRYKIRAEMSLKSQTNNCTSHSKVINLLLKYNISHTIDHICERGKPGDAQRSIFDELRGISKCGQTVYLLFDKSSSINIKVKSSGRKRKNKIVKSYVNKYQIFKHC